jgi:hypothetical protein
VLTSASWRNELYLNAFHPFFRVPLMMLLYHHVSDEFLSHIPQVVAWRRHGLWGHPLQQLCRKGMHVACGGRGNEIAHAFILTYKNEIAEVQLAGN